MRDIFQDFKLPKKPILVLGKGPTLDEYTPSIGEEYYVIGLNEVGTHVPVDITFLIHLEHKTDEAMILPYYPHIGKMVGPLDDSDSYHYNLSTAPQWHNGTPIITADGGFTIHALLNILGLLGVRDIESLGIDGGSEYSKRIEGSPRPGGYDIQFRDTDRILNRYGMTMTQFGNKAGHSASCQRVG